MHAVDVDEFRLRQIRSAAGVPSLDVSLPVCIAYSIFFQLCSVCLRDLDALGNDLRALFEVSGGKLTDVGLQQDIRILHILQLVSCNHDGNISASDTHQRVELLSVK
jgi:hypothetical protein